MLSFQHRTTASLFFFHNPKAAGTSIGNWIRSRYTKDTVSPLIENDVAGHRLNSGGYDRFRGYRLYIGHYGRDIYDSVSDGHIPVTSFRAPLSRIVSLYNFFRHAVVVPDGSLCLKRFGAVFAAKSYGFAEFAMSDRPEIAVYTCDYHFRQLTGSGWDLTERGSLASASALVAQMPWFYICDHAEASLRWASRALGWNTESLAHENATAAVPGRIDVDSIDHGLRSAILARNAKDVALYDNALDRLTRCN